MPPLRPEGPKPELQPESPSPGPSPGFDRGSSPRSAPYYSPPPTSPSGGPPTEAHKPASTFQSPRSRAVLGVIGAAVIALGAWYGFAPSDAPPPAPPIAAATNSDEKTVFVAAADLDQKATDQLKEILSGGAALATDDLRAENAAALRQLADKSPQMAQDIERDQRRLYRVYLLDFLNQDGDVTELQVDGVSLGDLNLSNAGSSFLIPVAPGKPTQMKLIAKADGGGGVTVAFISSAGEAKTNVMQVGDVDQWQVVVK